MARGVAQLRGGCALPPPPNPRDLPPLNRFSFAQRPELKAFGLVPNYPEALGHFSHPSPSPELWTRSDCSGGAAGAQEPHTDRAGWWGHDMGLGGRSAGHVPPAQFIIPGTPGLPGPALTLPTFP